MRSRAFIPRRDGPVKRKAFPWTTEKTEDPENKHTFFRFIDRYKSSLKYKDFPFTSQYLVFEFFLSIPIFYCILLLPKFGRLPAGESKCIFCTKISPFCFVTFVPPPPPLPSFFAHVSFYFFDCSFFLSVRKFFERWKCEWILNQRKIIFCSNPVRPHSMSVDALVETNKHGGKLENGVCYCLFDPSRFEWRWGLLWVALSYILVQRNFEISRWRF